MYCNACENNPCSCRKALATTSSFLSWIVQHCSVQGCDSAIRVRTTETLVNPICKWCDQKVSHATRTRTWPVGMPDPEFPWPWMTEQDRERKLRMPYWKDRFRAHGDMYKAWIRT